MSLHTLRGMSAYWAAQPAASRQLIGHRNYFIMNGLWLTVNFPAVTPGTPTRRHGGGNDPGGDHVHGIRSLPAPACGEQERWSMQLVSVGECLAFFQIPPDLVVKSQAIDIAEINSSRIRRPNAVPILCRNRISRFAQLSTSEAHWSTTKSDGMWARPVKDAVCQPVKVRRREQVSPS